MDWVWVTSVETSEPIGLPVARISTIEQKERHTGNVVAIFLDSGKEIRVMESLETIKSMLLTAGQAD